MLEQHGLASRAVVNATIQSVVNRRRMRAQSPVTTESLRHDVKLAFRERLLEYVCDPAIDELASVQRFRSTVEKLHSADRGSIAEAWYLARHAPKADRHVPIAIERNSGPKAGKMERRFIDAVQGKTAIEIKDVRGSIDRDQFAAYLELLQRKERIPGEPKRELTNLRYVLTNPDGAISNLQYFAEFLDKPQLAGALTIEVFDRRGRRHVVTTKAEAFAAKSRLEGERE